MKSIDPPSSKEGPTQGLSPAQRGLIAAQAMAKALEAEHKRWGLPLLTWKDGKVAR